MLEIGTGIGSRGVQEGIEQFVAQVIMGMDVGFFPFFFFLDQFLAKGAKVIGEGDRVFFKGRSHDIVQVSFEINNTIHIGGTDEYIQVRFQVRSREVWFPVKNHLKFWRCGSVILLGSIPVTDSEPTFFPQLQRHVKSFFFKHKAPPDLVAASNYYYSTLS